MIGLLMFLFSLVIQLVVLIAIFCIALIFNPTLAWISGGFYMILKNLRTAGDLQTAAVSGFEEYPISDLLGQISGLFTILYLETICYSAKEYTKSFMFFWGSASGAIIAGIIFFMLYITRNYNYMDRMEMQNMEIITFRKKVFDFVRPLPDFSLSSSLGSLINKIHNFLNIFFILLFVCFIIFKRPIILNLFKKIIGG